MSIKVRILGDKTYHFTQGNVTVEELLKKLNLNKEEYVVTKNGKVVTEYDMLEDNDYIILYPVVSGG